MIPLRRVSGGIEIPVKAVPRSSRDRIAGVVGGRLKVCVAAAPEKGRANARIAETLAGWLGLPASAASVVAGLSSPLKTVRLSGVSEEQLRERIGEVGA